MTVDLLIKINNIKATDLILKKEGTNTSIDPYVKIFFDGIKKFKTETITKSNNPVWKFEQTITIQLPRREELSSRKLDLECYDSCILGSDNLIGGVSIDFLSLLTGPVNNRFVLRNKGVPNGHIEFNLEIQELKNSILTFKNIKSTFYQQQSSSNEHYLYYYIDGSKTLKSYKSKRSLNYHWEDVDQVLVQTGLRDLLEKPIVFNIVSYKTYNPENDTNEGQTYVKLSNMIIDINQVHDNKSITFAEAIMNRGMVVGIIEGEIYFQNVSYFAQMREGVNTEVGIQGGSPYLPHSDNPINIPPPNINNTYNTPTPVTSTPSNPTPVTNITSTPITQSTPQPTQVTTAVPVKSSTPGIGLPDGWEMRTEQSGRVYYVHHPTKSTHWVLPEAIKQQMGSSASPPKSQPQPQMQQPQIQPQMQQQVYGQPQQPMMYPGVQPQVQPQGVVYPYGYQQPQYYVQQPVTYAYQYGSHHGHHHHCH